jgi:hypothetical protein
MSNVYLQKPLAPDALLGHVNSDGKVYAARFGPDKHVGRVELDTGKIFEARLGPDTYVGRVDLASGKVFRHKPLAADEYLGRVDPDGKCFRHKPLAPDEYVGRVENMENYATGGAALMLLVLAALEEKATQESEDKP